MPIRRIEGATPAPVINVNGKDVTLWNHGTIADGVKLTVNTLGPICSAINDGYGDLSAAIDDEKLRAIQAETDLSGWCDSLSSKLDTVSSNLDVVSGDLIDERNSRETKDEELQSQIDTLKAATDVIMVYGTYADFTANSASPSLGLTDADVIKVLRDETTNDEQVYYQWYDPASGHEWTGWSGIGSLDPYYSKTDLENAAGKNINITTADGIKINTNDNVVFTTVTSTGFSGTNLSGASKHDTIDNLFGSAYSGVAASAYITAHSADFLNSAHNAYGTLTFGTKAYPATNSNYNFTFLAGQGISFTTANNQVTISAEGTTYQAGNYISTANKTIAVTGSLLTSAKAGSAASAWVNNTLFDYSYYEGIDSETSSGSIDKITILYKNDAHTHDVMLNQEVVFKRDNYSVSGLLIQAATNIDDGKVLTYNTAYNNYTWQPIPPTTYSNDDDYISIDNGTRKINLSTTGIKTSAYSATYNSAGNIYNSYLNGQTLHFSYGFGSLDISFTGVSYNGGQGSTNWDNLFQNYAQVNREKINTSNLTADKVNFIVASGSSGTQPYKVVNFVVTSTLPTVLDSGTYYIV